MDEIEYQGLEPDLTAELGDDVGSTFMRGVVQQAIKPVSSAVVIGIGGSGIQSISRVKAAAGGKRKEQHARDAVAFLGIDAVSEAKMNPPLPAGVTLGPDLLNLQGFNAHSYLQGQRPNDPFLQGWWDDQYKVPNTSLNDGLRRERMLGRLCFHKDSQTIRGRLVQAISEAAGIREQHVAAGAAGGARGEIPIYLVSSCAGGTGSAGFLEVVTLIHIAAKQLNLIPKIRAFIVLPSVFTTNVAVQNLGDVAVEVQKANAYGFFKELDHFLLKSSELPAAMGYGENLQISDGDLIHQVYLFDSSLGNLGLINSPSDIYDIIAESIFNFLFSEMGIAILGVDGANVERELTGVDAFRKPRRYCSLGVARIVFPGDTFRVHLTRWWCDWMAREGFLRAPSDLEIRELHDSELVARLLDSVASLVGDASNAQFDDVVETFQAIGRDAPNTLKEQHSVSSAEEVLSVLRLQAPAVSTQVRSTLASTRQRLVERLKTTIERAAFEPGEGIKFAREVVKHAEKSLRDELTSSAEMLNSQLRAKESAEGEIELRMEMLAEAENRNLFEHAGAAVIGIFKSEVLKISDAGEAAGAAMKDWSRAVVEGEFAQARLEFVERAVAVAERLRIELERAEERMVQFAERARRLWEHDALLGKDAGPKVTTVLTPSDSQPQVEWSGISVATRRAIQEEHSARLRGALMREFLDRWASEGGNRGFFDYGSDDKDAAKKADRSLRGSLERDVRTFAWRTTDKDGELVQRLPETLVSAAERFAEETELEHGAAGVEALSKNVCWSWEAGRFHVDQAPGQHRQVDLLPKVTTAVARHPSAAALVERNFSSDSKKVDFPDPERLVALSCEWALPLHCLPVVDEWKASYKALAAKRQDQRQNGVSDIEPPNHIDKRFELLAEVVPEYFKADVAAPRFAKALLIHEALSWKETSSLIAGLFVRDATLPAVSPIRKAGVKGYVARMLTDDEGRLRPAPEDTEWLLGKTVHEAVREVGLNVALSAVIDLAWATVVDEVDAETLLKVLEGPLAKRIAAGQNARALKRVERDTYRHLQNAIDDIRDELSI